MINNILLIYTALVFAISMGLCVWIGTRRGLFNGAMRLSFFVLSGIIAFVITAFLSRVMSASLMAETIMEYLESEPTLSMPIVQELLFKLFSGLMAPIIFLVLFFVIDKLTFIPYEILKHKLKSNEVLHNVPSDKLWGALLGFVLAVGITVSCVMPVGGYPTFLKSTLSRTQNTPISSDIPAEVIDVTTNTANSPAVKIDYAVSGWLFNVLARDMNSVTEALLPILEVWGEYEDAESITAVIGMVEKLPPESLDLVTEIIDDLLQTEDNDPDTELVNTCLKDALKELSNLRKTQSDEVIKQEIDAIINVLTMFDNQEIEPDELLDAVLRSQTITNAVVKNSDTFVELYEGKLADMNDADKQAWLDIIDEAIRENDVDPAIREMVEKLFGNN